MPPPGHTDGTFLNLQFLSINIYICYDCLSVLPFLSKNTSTLKELTMIPETKEIEEQLKPIIINSLRIDDWLPEEMTGDTRLLEGDLEIDSVDILQLIIDIEKHFKIKLVSGEFDRDAWLTVSSLAEAIGSKMREATGKG